MRILLLEDNPDHQEFIRDACLKADESAHVDAMDTLGHGLSQLSTHEYDVCLCDLSFPGSPADRTAEALKQVSTDAAIIVVTLMENDSLAKQLLHHGVQDYIKKSDIQPDFLRDRLGHALQRKSYQQLLNHKQQNQDKLISRLAAELSEQLDPLPNVIELLGTKLDDRATRREKLLLNQVGDRSERALKLVEDFRQHLELMTSTPALSACFPLEILEAAKTRTLNKSPQGTEIFIVGETDAIHCVPDHLDILFGHIFDNAIKFNRRTPIIKVRLKKQSGGKSITIIVEDNGIGIPPGELHNIFTPFRTLHYDDAFEGDGLGLGIVHQIVQNMSGRIHVTSEVGAGSVFSIILPIKPPTGTVYPLNNHNRPTYLF